MWEDVRLVKTGYRTFGQFLKSAASHAYSSNILYLYFNHAEKHTPGEHFCLLTKSGIMVTDKYKIKMSNWVFQSFVELL